MRIHDSHVTDIYIYMNGPWEGQSIFERLVSILNYTIYI